MIKELSLLRALKISLNKWTACSNMSKKKFLESCSETGHNPGHTFKDCGLCTKFYHKINCGGCPLKVSEEEVCAEEWGKAMDTTIYEEYLVHAKALCARIKTLYDQEVAICDTQSHN